MSTSIPLQITVLGSGTSTGVPTIGCDCLTCMSHDQYNKRTRCSIMLQRQDTSENIVIDTSPDFRAQMLRHQIKSLSYVLYTHTHADHCHGFDDLRAFFFRSRKHIDCYISRDFQKEFRDRFAYAFQKSDYPGKKPEVDLKDIPSEDFSISGLNISTVRLPHGHMQTTGFRFGSFAYITDFKTFPEAAFNSWQGKIDTMIASGVRFKEHPTHSSVWETVELFKKLQVRKGIITHLSHDIDYGRDSKKLPENVFFAYDGMQFDVMT